MAIKGSIRDESITRHGSTERKVQRLPMQMKAGSWLKIQSRRSRPLTIQGVACKIPVVENHVALSRSDSRTYKRRISGDEQRSYILRILSCQHRSVRVDRKLYEKPNIETGTAVLSHQRQGHTCMPSKNPQGVIMSAHADITAVDRAQRSI